MPQPALLTVSNTILWLKVLLTAATLGLLYFRYKKAKALGSSSNNYPFEIKVAIVVAALFSFAVFHNLGTFRGGTFIHYGEMFHYYLGPKYFKELGHYELYNAVIAADTEQGNALAAMPFYTDLKTYRNTQREPVLRDVDRLRNLFSEERWSAFKEDVAFFKQATGMPSSPGLMFLMMDHGYNGSPVSTFILGLLTNAVPVTQLWLLASLDVLLVVAMGVLVFRFFGFEMGALFAVYFCINVLNARDYISGSILRYDWLFCIVAAVCLLERRRYGSSAFFLTLAAMLRVFPALLFYGIAVIVLRDVITTRALAKKHGRFILTAAVTAFALFLLPAVSLGSVLQPWKEFATKTALHNSGVYVNHVGLRGIVLFEPSHLSLESFVESYKSGYTNDIVRNWQNVKEKEFRQKRPVIVFATLLALICVSAIILRTKESESGAVLWSVLLIYTMSYPSVYYYAFLCLLVLLFFKRPNTLAALVPLGLLLVLNIAILLSDYSRPSPIVFYTLVNIWLFICLSSILGFELYTSVLRKQAMVPVANVDPPRERPREGRRRGRQRPRQR